MSEYDEPLLEDLSGGNSNTVQRRGDRVFRDAGPWTPTIHALLRALRNDSIDEVPEPFGIDDSGREVLSYREGTVGNYPLANWIWSETILEEASRLLKRIHQSTGSFSFEPAIWNTPIHEPAEVICHNDFAPYNMVFDDGHLVGIIDFDTASPGPRIWDFAYFTYRLVPFSDDAGSDAPRGEDRMIRLERAITAYGADFTIESVLKVMATRLDDLAEYTEGRAAETGNSDFLEHAAIYRRDAAKARKIIRSVTGNGTK